MLKYDVTYKNQFTEKEVTETLYFNLSKAEIVELMISDEDYLENLEAMAKRLDGGEMMVFFKDLLHRSYGKRTSENEFQKSTEISQAFLAGEAYSTFLWQLLMDPEKAIEFIQQIFPADLVADAKAQGALKPQDHLPKRTKNVFEQADLAEYKGIEGVTMVDAVSAYPETPNGIEVDKAAQEEKAYPMTDPDFEAYKQWRKEQDNR